MIELAKRQHEAGLTADGPVVLLGPAFLEAYDMRDGIGLGDPAANGFETFRTVLAEIEKAPAIQGDDVDLGGEPVVFHCEQGSMMMILLE